MPAKTSYQPGEPIWADLGTPDPEASRAFYGSLFGWVAEPGDEQFGGYASFALDGKKIAGLMPLMSPEQPPVWTCYVCSDDADKTTGRVEQAGGSVLAPPMDVADLGRMAVYVDAGGAVFGIWQPGRHLGAELVDEQGALAWIELSTRDRTAALPFYASVFGWSDHSSPEYSEFQQSGRSVAGLMDLPADVPAEVPAHWMPYFAAADPAAKAEQAASLGGTVVVPAAEFPGGMFAVVQDPHGSTFGLLNLRS